jgi:hypothetical protein
MDEAAANAAGWDFVDWAPALATRPVLLITANDGSYANSRRLATRLRKVQELRMDTDHPYSDHRIALESAVVGWLEQVISPGH